MKKKEAIIDFFCDSFFFFTLIQGGRLITFRFFNHMFYSVFDVFDLIFTRVYHVLYFFLRLICKTVEFVLQTFELSLIIPSCEVRNQQLHLRLNRIIHFS